MGISRRLKPLSEFELNKKPQIINTLGAVVNLFANKMPECFLGF